MYSIPYISIDLSQPHGLGSLPQVMLIHVLFRTIPSIIHLKKKCLQTGTYITTFCHDETTTPRSVALFLHEVLSHLE